MMMMYHCTISSNALPPFTVLSKGGGTGEASNPARSIKPSSSSSSSSSSSLSSANGNGTTLTNDSSSNNNNNNNNNNHHHNPFIFPPLIPPPLRFLWFSEKKIPAPTAEIELSDEREKTRPVDDDEEDSDPSSPQSSFLPLCESCPVEIPCVPAVHTRDSFSRFLCHASLLDVRSISKMAYLCNLAYCISDIKPGELLKYHKLRFVTSSLDKKVEAEEKAKDFDASAANSATLSKPSSVGRQKHEGNIVDLQSEENPLESAFLELVNAPIAANNDTEKTEVGSQEGFSCINNSLGGKTVHGSVSDISKAEGLEELNSLKQQQPFDFAALDVATPVAAVVIAEQETKQAIAKTLHSLHSSPCEWFVCDDWDNHTRFFVIQGSESLASWKANLAFEPTKFEGLGVLVHRGIYDAAKRIYEQVLPDILTHLKAHGDYAQIRFTGHSLGGSLALLVALMLLLRGVVSTTSLRMQVVTLGAPCIMCGGDWLLQKLKLTPDFIQTVMIHRDIIPRAFACDYPDHVAEVLKRLNGNFRDHPCLKNQRLLYAPMGQMLILQPEDTSHPLLPQGCGLFVVTNIDDGQDDDDDMKATQLRAAQRAFLNLPHPFEILSDPGAYGFGGSIVSDHDPRSYLKAINTVLWLELRRKRRMHREQRRNLWRPLISTHSSSLVQKGEKISENMLN